MGDKIIFVLSLSLIFLSQQFNASFLPKNLKPISYELVILTHVEKDSPMFDGSVKIKMKCVTETGEIILNQNALTIHGEKVEVWSLTADEKRDTQILIKEKTPDDTRYRYVITMMELLKEGIIYEVELHYSKYYMMSEPSGYAYISYRDKSLHSDIAYMTYTNMNEIDAMQVFPCVDEMDVKATFNIQLGHISKVKSFSNSKFLTNREMDDHPGWVLDKFVEMKNPISTFSVALGVVDYEAIDRFVEATGPKEEKFTTEIRVSAELDVLPHVEKVLNVASKSFSFFSEFMNAPYELGKLDLIVLAKHQSDVLSYYGVIYLEENDAKHAFGQLNERLPDKKSHSMVSRICRATCQQWIGHTVTMSLWSENWLHVGLNTFLEEHCINNIYPDWKDYIEAAVTQSFVELLRTEERGKFNPIILLGSDSVVTERALNEETFSKVHHTIRMLSGIMESGKDDKPVFKNAVRSYLEEFKWDNSSLSKVWKIFTEMANKEKQILPEGVTVEKLMNSWLTQQGHALLYVSRNEYTNRISVKQEPYEPTNKGKKEDHETKCWIFPLSFRIGNEIVLKEVDIQDWFKCDNTLSNLNLEVDKGQWIVFNSKIPVPLRVNYAPDLWPLIHKLLLDPLKYMYIDLSTRIQLVTDMFAFAEVKIISYESLFKTMKYLAHEEFYQCWNVAYVELKKIRSRWTGTKLLKPLQKYVNKIVQPILDEKIGSIGEFLARNERRFNPLERVIIKTACTFENIDCRLFSVLNFSSWYLGRGALGRRNIMSEDLSECTYCLAMMSAGAENKHWEFLKEHYTRTSSDNILNALGCSKNTKILNKFLEWGTQGTSDEISPELRLKIFGSLLANENGYTLVKNYLTPDNIENLRTTFLGQAKVSITIEDILGAVIEATKSKTDLDELVRLSKFLPTPEADKADVLEEKTILAEKNITWLQKETDDMIKLFEMLRRPVVPQI